MRTGLLPVDKAEGGRVISGVELLSSSNIFGPRDRTSSPLPRSRRVFAENRFDYVTRSRPPKSTQVNSGQQLWSTQVNSGQLWSKIKVNSGQRKSTQVNSGQLSRLRVTSPTRLLSDDVTYDQLFDFSDAFEYKCG